MSYLGRARVKVRSWKSRKVTKLKRNRTCGTWFIVSFARRIQKSSPFCNLTPCKSTTWKGQVNLVSHRFKFSNWCFRIKMCVSELVCSQDSKNIIFMSTRVLEMLKIAVKKWCYQHIRFVINRFGFWAICLPNINTSAWNLACQMSSYGSTAYALVLIDFGNLGLKQKPYNKSDFLGGWKIAFALV